MSVKKRPFGAVSRVSVNVAGIGFNMGRMENVGLKDQTPSQLIDSRIAALNDWRGAKLAHLRALIRQADPDVLEEWKWGIPVWSHDGLICTGETYKAAVKLTFAKGAALEDPTKLFNSSLTGNVRRAIDVHEHDAIDEDAFTDLIRAAVALNESSVRTAKEKRKTKK